MCDVSTLGKIDVQGPDAGDFLDRVYTNTFSTLPVGKARYGLMLREDGFVIDDGTTARLAEEHYLHDHHHGQCRQGHAASRILPAGAVAGARRAAGLGHRAMGAVCGRGAARARRAASCRRSGLRSLQRGLSLSRAAAMSRSAAALRRGCFASRSPASSPTSSPCRRATATPGARHHAGGGGVRHRALTAPRRSA